MHRFKIDIDKNIDKIFDNMLSYLKKSLRKE